MSLTLADYHLAVSNFAAAMEGAGDGVTAVYLFGSLVRGEAVAGYSDLDFWLFLHQDGLADQTRFRQLLTRLTEATAAVAAAGIPVYNASCYLLHEERHCLPALLAPNLADPAESRCIAGDDFRAEMQASALSRQYQQQSVFWDLRRQIYSPLFSFLHAPDPLPRAAAKAIWQALHYFKYLPEAVCAGLGHYPGKRQALPLLERLYPQENWSLFQEIRQFCVAAPQEKSEAPREQLGKVLRFVERLASLLPHPGAADE